MAEARAFVEVRGKGLVAGPPKSRTGLRTVGIPRTVVDALHDHLAEHAAPGPLVLAGPTGAPIRRGNFNKLVRWAETVERLGIAGPAVPRSAPHRNHTRCPERREHT